jgi:hypothetical protein
MPLRKLTEAELYRFQKLTDMSVAFTVIQPTRTGLSKAILDATGPVRAYLLERAVHSYDEQQKGPEHKKILSARLVSFDTELKSKASLYRPQTKNGDPRIWFSNLRNFAHPDDIIGLIYNDDELILINLSGSDVDRATDRQSGLLWSLLSNVSKKTNTVAAELLEKLRRIAARGLIRSAMDLNADTAVGRTLESELGIAMNSRREPDYKGIELKSFRGAKTASRENRKTLFAKVPNWAISKFKSSAEILDKFGYPVGDQYKLNCTVSARSINSQGLQLKIDQKAELLNECSNQSQIGNFVCWRLADLHTALLDKHSETFWIRARSEIQNGIEFFQFESVLHSSRPIASQFDILLDQGEITLDHLIKRNARGRTSERGPLFKIKSSAIPLLFPSPKTYHLLD